MDFYPVYSETKDMLDFEKHFKLEYRDYNDEKVIKTCTKLMMNCVYDKWFSVENRMDVARG